MRRLSPHLSAFACYLALTLLMLAPLLPHAREALIGGQVAEGDAWQNVWNLWWMQRALAEGRNPFDTPLLYYPEGVSLVLQTFNATNGLIAAPITWALGPIAGYNAAVVLAFALTGLGGYTLARRVSGSHGAALLGGALLTFSPYHLTKLYDGQLELIAMQWLPLYAHFLLCAAEGARRRDALLAGLMLALIGYTSWYYLLFIGIYSLLFAAIWLLAPPAGCPRRQTLGQLALAAAAGAALLLPLLLPALDTFRETRTAAAPDPQGLMKLIHSADLVDFWLPSALHPVWGAAVTAYGRQIHPIISAWNVALGYVALGLAVAALRLRWRAAWRWGLLALAGVVLALGPTLHLGGARTDIPMPYLLIALIPGADIANRPSHFVVLTVVLLAPLAALGAAALAARVSPRARRPLLLGVAALAAVELLPPSWPLQRVDVHPYFTTLAADRGPLIMVPPLLEQSYPLRAQMIHGRPIVGGFVSRTPPYPFARTPGVHELWSLEADGRVPFGEQPDDALVALNAYQLRQIVVVDALLRPRQRQAVDAALARILPDVVPAYRDAQLRVYEVPAAALRPVLAFGQGWYDAEQDRERRWRWMGGVGELYIDNPLPHPRTVRLSIVAAGYGGERSVQLALGGRGVRTWLVGPTATATTLAVLVPPGRTTLTLAAPAEREPGGAQRPLSIVLLDLRLR